MASVVFLDDARELRIAASRAPRRIGELCVREGKVIADIGKREWSPDEAEHYGRMLVYLAESARRGEGDG